MELITGEGFRPAVCTGYSGHNSIQNNEVSMTFYNLVSGNKKNLSPVYVESSDRKEVLGIPDEDNSLPYGYCYRIPDNEKINLGGFGSDEAYFGVEVTHNCQDTPSTCLSNQFIYDGYVSNFFSYSRFFFVMPNKQYFSSEGKLTQSSAKIIDLLAGQNPYITTQFEETIYV